MSVMSVPIDSMAPISTFSRGGASAQFAKVANNHPVTVLKNNKPEYVIISIDDFQRIADLKDEVMNLKNAEARRQAREHEVTFSTDSVDELMGHLNAL